MTKNNSNHRQIPNWQRGAPGQTIHDQSNMQIRCRLKIWRNQGSHFDVVRKLAASITLHLVQDAAATRKRPAGNLSAYRWRYSSFYRFRVGLIELQCAEKQREVCGGGGEEGQKLDFGLN